MSNDMHAAASSAMWNHAAHIYEAADKMLCITVYTTICAGCSERQGQKQASDGSKLLTEASF